MITVNADPTLRQAPGAIVRAQQRFKVEAASQLSAFVERVRVELVKTIEDQKFPDATAVPLSPRYAARKAGQDPRVLIRTKTYIDNISVLQGERLGYKPKQPGMPVLYIGLPPSARTKEGLPLATLARFLEYGTRNMPRRRHWEVALKYAKKNAANAVGRKVARAIRLS